MDAINLKALEGRTATETGRLAPALAGQIHATLQPDTKPPVANDPVPPLWHWCAFPTTAPTSALSQDGHPQLGDFLPPVGLSRRMWAGGSLDFCAPLRVGEEIERESMILRVDEKCQSDMPMVFVTVSHTLRGAQGIAIKEQQTIVYLNIPEVFTPPKKRPMPEVAEQFDVRETTLFRFSAVTFNAHRIHYDLEYTRRVERYPGLVIHGPLQAMKLMELAARTRGAHPTSFTFRGVHPMFLGAPLDLSAVDEGIEGVALYAGQSGHQGTVARAEWEGSQ